MAPTVSAPLRILVLSPPSTPQLPLLKDNESYKISTRYYEAEIPVWRDSLPISATELQAWQDDWSKLEAGEVVEAVGAWIIGYPIPKDEQEISHLRTSLRTIQKIIEEHLTSSYSGTDPLLIALLLPVTALPHCDLSAEGWEDLCREEGGWEYIDGRIGLPPHDQPDDARAVNEYGEKVGLARLKEALEANEWESGGGGSGQDSQDLDTLGEAADSDIETQEITGKDEDFATLRKRLMEDGQVEAEADEPDEEGVQMLEHMMQKMQAVRDMGADLPELERKKFAAKAMSEVIRSV